MGLVLTAPPSTAAGGGTGAHQSVCALVIEVEGRSCEDGVDGVGGGGRIGAGHHAQPARRKVGDTQAGGVAPVRFPQGHRREPRTLAGVGGRTTVEIRKGEGGKSVAPVGRAEDREQGSVLGDGKELAIAGQKAPRGEVPGKKDDLPNVIFQGVPQEREG